MWSVKDNSDSFAVLRMTNLLIENLPGDEFVGVDYEFRVGARA